MKLPRKLAILFLFIFLFLATYFLSLDSVRAQIPNPYVSCDETRDLEFHSLRPYQASPCNQDVSETKLYCGNDLIVKKTFKATLPADTSGCQRHPDGSFTCSFESTRSTNVSIDLRDAELPIMGNTQLVVNSQDQSEPEVLDDAEKTNEYVSWYLNGVINRAEYAYLNTGDEEDIRRIIDFSGPLNKLLPWEVQAQERIETIKKAKKTRHNQIVGCSTGPLSDSMPTPCYGDSPAKVRLADWNGAIAPEFLTPETTWNKRIPPLKEDFDDLQEYQKAYREWRGESCILVPIPFTDLKLLQCVDNPFRPNHWADLFSYIPLSSTEDRKGEVIADSSETEQPKTDDVNISDVKFESDNERDDIYFAHMQEVSNLADLLQKTYSPQGSVRSFGDPPGEDSPYDTDYCDLADVRWNSGDDLFGEWRGDYDTISGTLSYTASFSCHFSLTEPDQECKKDAYIAVSVYTKTPKANDVWDRLVVGKQSIFKRIYSGAMLDKAEIKDYPAVTTAHYEATDADEVLAGNPSNKRSGERAEIFIPHVGGIQEYFLKGIQKALRPKGFAE